MVGRSDPLRGKVALVTGSSRGLGRALALELAAAGADVVVTYRRNLVAAEKVVAAIRDGGRRAWCHQLDMGEVASIERLFAAIGSDAGALDVCVLNAAATSFRPLLSAEPRHLEKTYAISCIGFLRAVQLAVPMLAARGGGTIVGVSGADTRTWIPGHGILAGAKAAMEAMIRYLACEIGDTGITLLGVNPGTIMGDSLRLMLGEELFAHGVAVEERTHPLHHAAQPGDIAAPIVLLCTPAARFLHGTVVDLDGGSIFAMCGRWMSEAAEGVRPGRGGSVGDPEARVPAVARR
jgi:NAD(P)-dependent dehydrogenase (short-subunit alcohol dehydrogenase family)